MAVSRIIIIYNPNSTGNSEKEAHKLERMLHRRGNNTPIECIPTQYAGHAEKLASEYAKKEDRPLIISSSGDGGYNEVVNGVISAENPRAVCAVLPAGNANDHGRTMQKRPLADAIGEGKVTRLDLLEVTIKKGSEQIVRYAHSYAGLGITPVVAVELNRHSLNPFKELYLVFRTFLKYRPFMIVHAGRRYTLDSLLFGNINQMAKVLTIAPQNRPADGKFEIILFPSGKKWLLVRRLAKAAVNKLEHVSRASHYEFSVLKKMPMQLDGEVTVLEAGSKVSVKSCPKLLRTML